MNEKLYPEKRNLDGVYYRIMRDDKPQNVCFSDLTSEERDEIIQKYDIPSLQRLCLHLSDCLRRIGDELDLYAE